MSSEDTKLLRRMWATSAKTTVEKMRDNKPVPAGEVEKLDSLLARVESREAFDRMAELTREPQDAGQEAEAG